MAHFFACVQLESEECICIFVGCGCIVHICLHMFKVKSVFEYLFVLGVLRTFVCILNKGTSCHGAHVNCECIVYVCCACIVHMFTFVMGAYHSMRWL